MVKAILLMAAITVAAPATARDGPLYLGASIGLAEVDGTASTDGLRLTTGPGLPDAVPLDGLPFDDDDGTWSAFLGYEINRFVAVEVGYADLGRHSTGINVGPAETPRLEAESAYLAGRLSFPLTEHIDATWRLGLSQTWFDAEGSTFAFLGSAGPIVGRPVLGIVTEIPFADPDDETGLVWGFGFDWRFAPRFSAEIGFTRHDVQVLDVDTYNLRLRAHL